ncbi:MAG: hypothetical protein ACREI9_12015, partial [Nitrospiraceae bacterium]
MFRHPASLTAFLLPLLTALLASGSAIGQDQPQKPPQERRHTLALADAVVQALERNLDISISRKTKDSRISDIVSE